jgi:hypothetical protein
VRIKRLCKKFEITVWENDIKMNLIEWEVAVWIHLVRDREKWRAFVKGVMNRQVSSGTLFGKRGELSDVHEGPCCMYFG